MFVKRTSVAPIVLAVAVAVAVALALVACTTTTSPSPSASVDVLAEIAATAAGLDDALAKYEAGDVAGADLAVGDAYLEHFELVEHPLAEADEELTEELEDLIRDELRASIQDEKPLREIEALVNEAKAGLERAEELLR